MVPLVLLSTSVTLTPLKMTNQWCKFFPGTSTTTYRRNSNKLPSFFRTSQSGKFGLNESSSYEGNGVTPQISDGETVPPFSFSWPNTKKPRVCILGGGFGGLYTALRLESVLWLDDNKPQVLLVDRSDRFVFNPMLYELLSGGDSAALRDSSGRILPATAQVAFQQADFAGWNPWYAINDRPLLPFSQMTKPLSVLLPLEFLSPQLNLSWNFHFCFS